MEEEYTLKSVREAIHSIYESYQPHERTAEIKELLEKLYEIEQELQSKEENML